MDAGLPRYNTPSRYLDSTTKSPYGRTVVNQYLHRIVEAAGQRQISGEYLPFTLEEHPLLRTKEGWRIFFFRSPRFRQQFYKRICWIFWGLFQNEFAESSLEVASETDFPTSRWKLLQNFTSQFRTQTCFCFRTQIERKRERVVCCWFVSIEKLERYL